MRSIRMVIVAVVLAFAAGTDGQSLFFTGTWDEALALAKAANKKILLEFYSAGSSLTWKKIGEEFLENPRYRDFLSKNFVLFRADRRDSQGKVFFDKYKIQATPTLMILDADGTIVDWIIEYKPPAEEYRKKIERALQGIDTYKSWQTTLARDPENVEAIFKIGWRYMVCGNEREAWPLFKKVVSLDPEGRAGMTTYPWTEEQVSYTEFAEFLLIQSVEHQASLEPLRAFVKKYSGGIIVRDAYRELSRYYQSVGTKEEANQFFEEYTSRYPQDASAFAEWTKRILFDKGPFDRGIELAQKAVSLAKDNEAIHFLPTLARLYSLKGEKDKAIETVDRMAGMKADSFAEGQEGPILLGTAEFLAARSYIELGRPDKAEAVYGPAYLAKNAKNAQALRLYAQFWWLGQKKPELALQAAKMVVELTPDKYSAYSALAQILEKLENYQEALRAAEKAVALSPPEMPELKGSFQKIVDRIRAAMEKK